jgi:hypothetical protein
MHLSIGLPLVKSSLVERNRLILAYSTTWHATIRHTHSANLQPEKFLAYGTVLIINYELEASTL